MTMASARQGLVRLHIDAPPDRVWSLLAAPSFVPANRDNRSG
jgi:uncharacterized protein YndB with AHSA1/START domain